MPLPDQDSGVGHSFGLELDGVNVPLLDVIGLVLSVVGLAPAAEDEAAPRPKQHSITLVRALTRDRRFADWVRQANELGVTAARRSATIVVFAVDGTPVARYHLEHAWPAKLEVPSLRSSANEVAMESLELCHEGLTLV
jgi:phage tail-like protein